MEITKSKESIIEFIKPCMNKTLSEGCLVKDPANQIAKIISIEDKFYNVYYIGIGLGVIAKNSSLEIIGHYDITAIIKFFENKIYKIRLCDSYLSIEYPDKRGMSGLFNLKTKPLHLYTEEEDKNLLGLLKELGNLN